MLRVEVDNTIAWFLVGISWSLVFENGVNIPHQCLERILGLGLTFCATWCLVERSVARQELI